MVRIEESDFYKRLQRYVFRGRDNMCVVMDIADMQDSGWPIDWNTGEDLELYAMLEPGEELPMLEDEDEE